MSEDQQLDVYAVGGTPTEMFTWRRWLTPPVGF